MASIPIRCWMIDGTTKYRMVEDLEHGTLCRLFGLDPCSIHFDLPSTARGIGSSFHGFGNNYNSSSRVIEGYILMGDQPVGRLWIAKPGDTFRDLDPTNSYSMMNDQHINK